MKKLTFLLLTTLLACGYLGWGQIIISQYDEGATNDNPVIINIGKSPVFPDNTESVSVFADVTDSDGTLVTVELHWGTASGVLSNTINMSVLSDDTYITDSDIPAQPNNTTVYFEIYAEDNEGGTTTCPEQTYVLPATTPLPYMESFDADMGSCYVYSAQGNTKAWNWNALGFAQVNGYNSGDTEEDWLILPGIDLDSYDNEIMTFDTWYRFGTGDDETDHYLKLFYSSDYQGTGDPGDASWTEIPFTHPADPQNWTSSGNIDLSGLSGTVYLAFKYYYTDAYRWWEVDNISIYEGMLDLTFQVDMSQQSISGDGVFLVGDFSPFYNDWDLGDLPMDDSDADQIYTITLSLPAYAFYQFKYVNGLDWADAENPPPACTADGNSNRVLATGNADAVLELVCYGLCTDCTPDSYDVTFRVNMQNETVNGAVYLAGNLTNWTDEEMTNTTGSIWEVTMSVPEGQYLEYKFKNGAEWETIGDGGCTNWNGNREGWGPGSNTVLDLVCYGSCFNCGIVSLPYSENFDTGLGDCASVSVSGPDSWVWFNGSDAAAMDGSSGELEEDWLILPPFNFNNSTDEKMTFDTWYGEGTEDENNYLKLFYSTDYPGTGDPDNYTWSELYFDKPWTSGIWGFSNIVDLSFISGSTVFIAYKYHYNPGSYMLWEVDNIAVFEGELVNVTFQVNMEEQTVSADGVHIAGSFNGWNTSANEMTDDDADNVYTATLSLYKGVTYTFKYFNGNAWGTDEDVPEACRAPYLSDRFETVGDVDYTIGAVCFSSCTNCGGTALPYSQHFDTGLGDCASVSVSGDTKYWEWLGGPNVAAMNGFNSGDLEEDWLILPSFNFDNYANEKMTFRSWYANGVDDENNYLKLLYSTDYQGTGDPDNYTWTELTFNRPYSSGHWEYSDVVDLSFISGTGVYLAFKYHYNPGSYMLWGIDDLSVFEGEQVNVTFQVNMEEQTVSADGVHIAGSFNGWSPSDTPMSDDDGDEVFTTTLSLYKGVKYTFKYFNGNDWGTEETVPAECSEPNFTHRVETIGDTDYTIDAVCFSSCTNCGEAALPYYQNFDTGLGDCASVSVSGDTKYWEWLGGADVASMNGYDSGDLEEDWLILPAFNFDNYTDEKMTFDTWNNGDVDDSDNYLKLLYSTDYPGTGDPENYTWDELYFNRPYSGGHWEYSYLVDLSFITGSEVHIAYKYHYNPGSYVWWGVDNIAVFEGETVNVTFQVNMEEQTVSADGVHLAGSFNGWNTSDTEMFDDDGDDVYTTTLSLYKGVTYMYKYLNGNDWGTEETVPDECTAPYLPDRYTIVGNADYTIGAVCFGSCTDCGQNNITFRVDMQNEAVSGEGVYLAGDFTNWGNAPLLMSQDGNIWSVTVSLPATTTQNYKFVNGDPNGGSPIWEGFSGTCTTGDYNDRYIDVPSENTVLGLVCFNSCEACQSMPLIFSEIALPYDHESGKFVELFNAGGSAIDFDSEVWYLCRQANGNPTAWGDFRLSGSIDPGGTLTIVPDEAGFNALYAPLTADLVSSITSVGGGNDGFYLFAGGDHTNGTLVDAYGVINENGNGMPWNYNGTKAVRLRWVNAPSPIWYFWEWNIPESAGSDQTTPGEHKSNVSWQGTTDENWATKGNNWSGTYGYIPDASFNVTIPDVAVKPWIYDQAACNNLTINASSHVIVDVAIFDIYGNLDVNSGGAFYMFASQTLTSSVIVQGTATGFQRMTRYFKGYNEGSNGWHNISSPMNNLTIAGTSFEPGDNDDLYQWDEPSNTWENYKQGHFTNFENGRGYLNAFEESNYKNFDGTLNTGDIFVSGLTKDNAGFQLLGNPFSSALLWDNGNWNMSNIGAIAQIWDETNNSYTQIAQNGTIPATNGFFVEVGTAPGSLTIPKYARIHDMVSPYKKAATADELVETLDIRLTNDQNNYYDRCRVGFKADATEAWDIRYDAHKLNGGSGTSQIWTAMDDEKFVFNFLPNVYEAYQVPLHVRAGVSGTHHIHVEGIESFGSNSDIYLEDQVENEIIKLSDQQIYSFSASTTDNTDRFILHFFGVNSVGEGSAIEGCQIYANNKTVYIQYDQLPENDFEVSVFNTTGQQVYASRMHAGVLNSFTLNVRPGIYIVQLRSAGDIRVQKIMIK